MYGVDASSVILDHIENFRSNFQYNYLVDFFIDSARSPCRNSDVYGVDASGVRN